MKKLRGLIDLHVNGAAGKSFFDSSFDDIEEILRVLRSKGTGKMLASFITSEPAVLLKALENVSRFIEATNTKKIAGFHLEGPFLNPECAGAHDVKWLKLPDVGMLRKWQEAAAGKIKMITIAPELKGATEVIRWASQHGILVSLGHSNATARTVREAVDAGARVVTHLFNGMAQFHHRRPSILDAALLDERLHCELICDGQHLSDEAVRLALRCKGLDRLFLASDCMPGMGMTNGSFKLLGSTFKVLDGKIICKNGTIGGSSTPLVDQLQNFVRITGMAAKDAINLCTRIPARLIGL